MAYVAVLDADVLHPYISVDLLVRLAERRLFRPAWTEEILREVRESLIRRGLEPLAPTFAASVRSRSTEAR